MYIENDFFPPEVPGAESWTDEASAMDLPAAPALSGQSSASGKPPTTTSTGLGIGDRATFSAEAVRAFKESAIEPIKNGTFTLKGLESRINVVRAEIAQIWSSALPDGEKYRQISARDNEIALLQAGQFAFAKAGFSLTA
jgi:hypothetical protein